MISISDRKGKRIYVGWESSGKSLLMAAETIANIDRNARWNRITGLSRPIVGNLPWSDSLLDYAKFKGVEIRKFRDVSEFPYLHECDLYIDELGTYFDSRLFADLPLNIRLWLAQAEKIGVQIVGSTQDFGQVDKSFRRLCKEVYEIRKPLGSRRPMRTAPPVNFIWGVMLAYRLDPRTFTGEQVEMQTVGLPTVHFIRKKHIRLFDTNSRIALSEPPPLQRVVRHWTNPETGLIEKTIIKFI